MRREGWQRPVCVCGVLTLSVIVGILKIALSDPGYIPDQTEDKYCDKHKSAFKPYLVVDSGRAINSSVLRLQFCQRCNIYKPPRTVHCEECDACIANYDHHCKLLSNCIGSRSFKYYFWLLVALWNNFVHTANQNSWDLANRIKVVKSKGLPGSVAAINVLKQYPTFAITIPLGAVLAVLTTIELISVVRKALRNETGNERLAKTYQSYTVRPFD